WDGRDDPEVEIVPGVTAALTAAARLGAPLAVDFACLSLSDLLVPWELIERRLEAIGAGDLAVALYNPRSRARPHALDRALTVLRPTATRPPPRPWSTTPAGPASGSRSASWAPCRPR